MTKSPKELQKLAVKMSERQKQLAQESKVVISRMRKAKLRPLKLEQNRRAKAPAQASKLADYADVHECVCYIITIDGQIVQQSSYILPSDKARTIQVAEEFKGVLHTTANDDFDGVEAAIMMDMEARDEQILATDEEYQAALKWTDPDDV